MMTITHQADSYCSAIAMPLARASELHAARPCEPRYVRQVAAFLASNFARPIRMAELSSLTGVGIRSIQVGFRKHRGCSPLAFLRALRLKQARALLCTSQTKMVAEVAYACGFEHLGRFSAQYRAEFGESPRQTRERRGPHSAQNLVQAPIHNVADVGQSCAARVDNQQLS